jgi:hypothetical protein
MIARYIGDRKLVLIHFTKIEKVSIYSISIVKQWFRIAVGDQESPVIVRISKKAFHDYTAGVLETTCCTSP